MEGPASNNTVQVVDFASFLDGSAKEQVADQMLDSFKNLGFVYLTNFGLSNQEVQEMFHWSKCFFSLPLESKLLAPHPASGTHHRGYSSVGLEKGFRLQGDPTSGTVPQMKESFESGREGDETMPNIWLPDGVLPGFKEACLNFFWKCHEIQQTILRALAVGFRLEEDWFIKYHTKPENQLRLLHYPSVPLESLRAGKVARVSSHADYITVTLLFQDDIGGLEVEDPNTPGKFLPVPPIPGSVVVNPGDLLQRWSNDVIRSAVHHVRAPQEANSSSSAEGEIVPDRYSIPYFCCPDFDTMVEAIPGTWSVDHPKKYEPVSTKEYVMRKLAANY